MARILGAGLAALALAFAASAAAASPNLLVNPDFEQVQRTGTQREDRGQIDYNVTLPGWRSTGADGTIGYNFVYEPYTVDEFGSPGQLGYLKLWGPKSDTPSNNGLPPFGPAGGNFIGIEADDYANVPVQQTVGGMAPGSEYALSFYSGVGQQYGYSGAADVTLAVSLGNDTQTIGPIHNESHGFTGWAQHTLSFTATASSEVLSFLATGTPSGVPPFVLLDAMSLSQIPEPGSIALLGAGLAGLGLICLRRR